MKFFTTVIAFLLAAVARSMDLEALLSKEVHLFSTPTQEPTAEPTLSPTRMPTASPTAIDLIDFTAGHVLHNINSVEYNDQATTYNGIFKQILATIMSVSESSVAEIEVKVNKRAFNGRVLTTGDTSYMQYRVVVHDHTKSFASLSALLKAAVTPNPSTGVIYMNTLIASLAPGGSPLAAATIDQVDIENNLGGRDASSQLTGSMIAGLVIGIVLFLLLLGVVVAFFVTYKGNASQPSSNSNGYTATSTTELVAQV